MSGLVNGINGVSVELKIGLGGTYTDVGEEGMEVGEREPSRALDVWRCWGERLETL